MSSVKEYVFYPPKTPQFFFPRDTFKGFQKHYMPYSLKAKIFWGLYKNSKIIRRFFLVKEDQIPLPITEIKTILDLQDNQYQCLFNLGTKGPEQKATIVANTNDTHIFLKFAQSNLAKALVSNEYNALKELENQSFIEFPKIINYSSKKPYNALTTQIIDGDKLEQVELSDRIIKLLLEITKIRPIKTEKEFQIVFSHGDFCPWNILVNNTNNLVLIDWEMANDKPLGYDLFTFIFQTTFLLMPQKTIKATIDTTKNHIDSYFCHFKIKSWQPYLKQFAILKLQSEQKKGNSFLKEKYQELLAYEKS